MGVGLITAPTEPAILLLEVQVGTRVLRFAERPVEIEGLRWTGGLSAEFIEELELTADGPPVRSVSVQLAGEASWGGLRGHLQSARARLYLWAGGATRELVLTGTMDQPAVCDPDLPPGVAAFTVTEIDAEERPLLVETALVDDTTHPIIGPDSGVTGDQVADAYAGTYYPEIIGQPGYPFPTWFSAVGVAPGAPCPWTQHKAGALFASGSALAAKRGITRLDPATGTRRVRLWDQDGATSYVDLVVLRDLRGQAYTSPNLTTATGLATPTAASDVSSGWATGWTYPPTTGPGGALRGLGDVLIWALERAGVDRPGAQRGRAWDIDWPALLDARESLNRFKIDTYISEQVGVWEWLTSDVLPFFPVFVGRTGRGLYLGEWRYAARAAEAALTIEMGRTGHRIATVAELDRGDVYTEVTARFGFEARAGTAIRSSTFTGAAAVGLAQLGQGRHPALERAWGDRGRRSTVIDLPVVWDRATGWEVAEYLVARYAQPLVEVWARLPWQRISTRPGAIARVIDDEAGLDAVGTVTARKPGPGCIDVRVLLNP